MKTLLKEIVRNDRSISKSEKALEKIEKELEKNEDALKKELAEAEKNAKELESATPHMLALTLSENVKRFYNKEIKILQSHYSFEEEIRSVLLKNITAARQMEAFERLSKSLTESEKAVEMGMSAMLEILQGVTSEEGGGVSEAIKVLKESYQGLEYIENVEQFVNSLAVRIERQGMEVNNHIQAFNRNIQKIISEAEGDKKRVSEALGKTMATMMNKKTQIDETYMKEAEKFEEKLKKRDEDAAKAYQEARQFRRRADTGSSEAENVRREAA
ncbi:hypothetical protein ACFLTH_16045, partial [Bacteroidota bacterium]